MSEYVLSRWARAHPRFGEIIRLAEREGQAHALDAAVPRALGEHVLVATVRGPREAAGLVGFLRLVLRPIGLGEVPVLSPEDSPLTEACIAAQAVVDIHQGADVGDLLHREAAAQAHLRGCHQLVGQSLDAPVGEHRRRIARGFAVWPDRRPEGAALAYALPLRLGGGTA